MLPTFHFEQPSTLAEALRLAAAGDHQLVNGGTDVVVQMRATKIAAPMLISLNNLEELKRIDYQKDTLFIGAGVTFSALQRNPLVTRYCPVLADGASKVGSPQIRNTGTIGGNVCTASPAGDGLTALIAENSQAEICSLQESRLLPVSELIIAPKRTCLKKGEIIRGFYIKPEQWTFARFFKVGKRNSLAISIVNGAVKLMIKSGMIAKASLTVGAVAEKPFHVEAAEKLLIGSAFDQELKESLRLCVSDSVSPIDDIRASGRYRRYIAGVQCARLAEEGWEAALKNE